MTELSYMSPGVLGFVDRRTRLLVIGILMLVAGVLCLVMAMFIPMMMYLPRPPGAAGPKAIDLVPGMVVYIAIAAVAITLSVGMMRVQRWVRPVILCLSTMWLIIGVGALVLFFVTLPRMLEIMKTAGGTGAPVVPRGVAIAILASTSVFMVVMYLVVPALLMLAVRSRDVQATLEFFDPHPRWTDGVPLMVLGLCMVCVLGAVGTLFSMPRGLCPFFGIPLFGWPGRIVLLIVCTLMSFIARLIYLRQMAGWWMLMITTIVLPISWVITLLRVNLTDVYEQMGMDMAQLKAMHIDSGMWAGTMIVQTVVFSVVLLYLTWKARRHFEQPAIGDARTEIA